MFRLPSSAHVISIISLVIALGGAGYSATGGNFILGQTNSATTQTKLLAPIAGASFRVDNTSTAAAATAMTLVVKPGRPPFAVNSAVKVANLNADRLDGLDSTLFARRVVVSFNLAPGANSAPITPPANRPVFLMGVTTTQNYRGVGQVSLLRVPTEYIMWVASGSWPGGAAITSGYQYTAGSHIVNIDFNHQVYIEVNSADTIRIHNGSTVQQTGTVTLIW